MSFNPWTFSGTQPLGVILKPRVNRIFLHRFLQLELVNHVVYVFRALPIINSSYKPDEKIHYKNRNGERMLEDRFICL